MIKQILLVGLGGGLGSIFRFLTSVLTAKYYSNAFPLATFRRSKMIYVILRH